MTEAALRGAKAVVVLWSPRSVISRWVRAEATVADRNKTLMPVMIEPCERPVMFELTQTAELFHWQGAEDDPAWRSFVHDVQSLVGKDMSAAKVQETSTQPSKPVDGKSESAKLALLPFADLSTGKDQQPFIEGLNEEIRDGMAHRASTVLVEGKDPDARYRLEGSVRGSTERLRVTIKLIQSSDDKQLWSKRFDGVGEDEFTLQEQIASAIAARTGEFIWKAEVIRLKGLPDDQRSAADYVLMSMALIADIESKSIKLAIEYAEKAIAIKPDLAAAHALAARHYSILHIARGDWDPDEIYDRALNHANKAIRGADQDSFTLQMLSLAMPFLGGNLDPLEAMVERLLTKLPNDSSLCVALGGIKAMQGKKVASARKYIDTAIRLNPNSEGEIFVLSVQMACHFELGEFARAVEVANELTFRRKNLAAAFIVAVASYAHLGEMDAARKALTQIRPEMRLDVMIAAYRDPDTREMLRSGLQLAGADV